MTISSSLSYGLGIGLYSVTDVSRLLKIHPQKIRRWLGGYTYTSNGEDRTMPALWDVDLHLPENQIELSFRDMIELRIVKAFLDADFGLHAIRTCLQCARSLVDYERPFSSGEFRTDGKTIFLRSIEESGEPKLLDLKSKQYVFAKVVEQSFKDLDLEQGLVARWRPYRGKESIVIDPTRAFGQPVAALSGVPTVTLAEAVAAEGSESKVALLYEVDVAIVRDAVKFQKELMAA